MAGAPVDISRIESYKLQEKLVEELSWAVIGFDASVKSKLVAFVQAAGDGGLEPLKANLFPDQIQFACIRVMGVDPKGAVVSRRAKYIFVTYVGSAVAGMKKIAANSAKKTIGDYLRAHLAIEINDPADLSEADLEKRLRSIGGAHQPERFDFGAGTTVHEYVPKAEAPAAAAAAVVAEAKPTVEVKAPAAGGASSASPKPAAAAASPASPSLRTASATVPASATAGAVDVSALHGAQVLERLQDEAIAYAVIGFDAAAKKPRAVVQKEGDGGLENVRSALSNDEVQFVLARVMGVDPKGSVVSRRAKFIFLTFVGPHVPGKGKSHAATAKKIIGDYFQGHHLALEINDPADVNEENLEKRLRAIGGAHQPERFDFGTGSRVATFTPEEQPTHSPRAKGAPVPPAASPRKVDDSKAVAAAAASAAAAEKARVDSEASAAAAAKEASAAAAAKEAEASAAAAAAKEAAEAKEAAAAKEAAEAAAAAKVAADAAAAEAAAAAAAEAAAAEEKAKVAAAAAEEEKKPAEEEAKPAAAAE